MTIALRLFLLAVAIALVAAVDWRILKMGMSDHLVAEHPGEALEWNPGHPDALEAIAKEHLKNDEPARAEEFATALLRREPASGQGFVVLSGSARLHGDSARASEWSRIALRYAPQALSPREWLASEQLASGNYAAALDNLDQILRVWPKQSERVFSAFLDFARSPEFADALAAKLTDSPPWKGGMMNTLLTKGSPEALDRVLSAMQRQGALDAATAGRWIDQLAKQGAWGEAYARWVSAADRRDSNRLSNVYNGGFESPPSNAGFDWRIGDSAGVVVERAAVPGATGNQAISLMFLGRRSEIIPLNHWLLLSSGSYRLTFRATADEIRSDRGVEWVIRCQPSGKELDASERMNGDFDWSPQAVEFRVPDSDCPAQDLQLRNAGANGPGKIMRGSISFDDFAIVRTEATD